MTNVGGGDADGELAPGGREPIWFEIRVGSLLDEHWSASFTGMRMTALPGGTTRLVGPLTDEAALHGVLSRIRDLGLPLLLVRRIASEPAEES